MTYEFATLLADTVTLLALMTMFVAVGYYAITRRASVLDAAQRRALDLDSDLIAGGDHGR